MYSLYIFYSIYNGIYFILIHSSYSVTIFSVIHWKGNSGFYWQIQRESTRTTTKRLFYLYHSLPHDSRSVPKPTKEKKISQGLNSYLDRCILGVSWAPQPFRLDYLLCPHFPILHVFFRKNFQWKRLWSIPAEKFVYSDQFKWKIVIEKLSYNKICAKWQDTKQENILGLSFKGSRCIEEQGKQKRGWKKGREEEGREEVFSWTDL